MPACIFAFDGVLADTVPLRAQALALAAEAEGQSIEVKDAEAVLPGCTFVEATTELLGAVAHDPTVVELVALRAQHGYRALIAHGVSFGPEPLALLHAAARRGERIVVRADSERRDVEPLLALAGLEDMVHLVRASDDPPRSATRSLERSWQAIDHRLCSLSLDARQRTAWEATHGTATAAMAYSRSVHLLRP